MQTGNRTYSGIERKLRKRRHRRANTGMPSLARQTRGPGTLKVAMTLPGELDGKPRPP